MQLKEGTFVLFVQFSEGTFALNVQFDKGTLRLFMQSDEGKLSFMNTKTELPPAHLFAHPPNSRRNRRTPQFVIRKWQKHDYDGLMTPTIGE